MLSCSDGITQKIELSPQLPHEFNEYWNNGEAELSRYELEQARYGEIHKGEAVLIFVTEDFRTDKQVKYEGGDKKNVKPILKLNFTKKFFTGLYPYSIMSSIFSPVDNSKTLKVSTSIQEWCGHAFSQLNLKKDKYEGQLNSYFQNEGDQEFKLAGELLEDELWTMIRLNPSGLPTGSIKIIPGTQFVRLKHYGFEVEEASASLEKYDDKSLSDQSLLKYSLSYSQIDRKLDIIFESVFPYAILAWEEHSTSGLGNAKTTKAKRTNVILSPYWNLNSVKDGAKKKQLGLDSSNY